MKNMKAHRLYNAQVETQGNMQEGQASQEQKNAIFNDTASSSERGAGAPEKEQTDTSSKTNDTSTTAGERPANTQSNVSPAIRDLSPEQLAAIVRASVEGTKPTAQAPQMTQAEFNKKFNVVNVTEDHVNKIFNNELTPAQRAQALQDLLHATARQAVTMAGFQTKLDADAIRAQMTPLQQYYLKQEEEQHKVAFIQQNPDLKGYEPVVELIYKQMLTEGKKFADAPSAYKAIADRARGIIPTLKQVTGTSTSNGASNKPVSNASNKMPTLSGGGQGGAGGKQGQAEVSKGHQVFA